MIATLASAASERADVLIELGAVLVILAVAGRFAARFGLPSISLYLAAGLLLGEGTEFELDASQEFISVAADVGVVLLLLLLGVEYTAEELREGLTKGWLAGVIDFLVNATPGLVMGLALGWGTTAAIVLAGVTYISSSGIIAKQLADLDRIANRETPTILSLLVFEDLAMAAYLPIVGVLLVGSTATEAVASVVVALLAVGVIIAIASRHGPRINRVVDTGSSELFLLGILGLALLFGGLAERLEVSAAVTAFLVGVTLSDRVAERARELLVPVRDVFAGLFFVFFGLRVDPSTLPPVLWQAALLAVVTAATKVATGWWAAKRAGVGPRGRVRAGASLIPRGEFSIVIAGLAVAAGSHADFGALATTYVLLLAALGPVAMRYADHLPLKLAPSRHTGE
jgi:CPA2 family monovalent cation:H+ antiporter-2